MSRAARRAGARPSWREVEEQVRADARRAGDEARARERQKRRDRALANARDPRYDGPSRDWRIFWRFMGLDDDELDAIRAEVTLGGSP